MRLRCEHFRKLHNVKINLDGRIIAVVGPNEAGKSSLIAALLSLEDQAPFPRTDWTRGEALEDADLMSRRRICSTSTTAWRWKTFPRPARPGI